MIYMPSIIIVGYYFESKRSLATGIAVCGSGVGSIVVPPLANFVLTYFESWTYVVILFGGMFLMYGSCHFNRASNDKFSVECSF